jgi:hypothetical protein
LWDKRGYFTDTVKPAYNLGGKAGIIAYSITAALPLTFSFESHSLSASSETKHADNKFGISGAKDVNKLEFSDFYQSSVLGLELSPELSVGVQAKPMEMISIQGGLSVALFSFGMKSDSAKAVKYTADQITDFGILNNRLGNPGLHTLDEDMGETTFEFTYPKVSLALGLTFNFGKAAALDLAFIRYANPTATGMIYKAIGDGLLSDETSLVFSLKF